MAFWVPARAAGHGSEFADSTDPSPRMSRAGRANAVEGGNR